MIRLIVTEEGSDSQTTHSFQFISADARNECETLKEALRVAIANRAALDGNAANTPPPSRPADPLSAEALTSNIELQQSLLRNDKRMQQKFQETVIAGTLSSQQFWLSRINLLRAHLIEKSQERGPYNVLATIRPKTVDNQIKVSLTREKIRDVFQQFPLLKQVYAENVPPVRILETRPEKTTDILKLTEDEFWSRFFLSKLCKKLRAERLTASDPTDDRLDRYLNVANYDGLFGVCLLLFADLHTIVYTQQLTDVDKLIDLEGNESNVSIVRALENSEWAYTIAHW